MEEMKELKTLKRPGRERIMTTAQKFGLREGKTATEEGMEVVFVYGTLQPGWGLYSYLAENVVSYLPETYLEGYRMYAWAYPWAVKGTSEDRVWGTVLYLWNGWDMLQVLDDIELAAGYERCRVAVRTPQGEEIMVWAYLWKQDEPPIGAQIKSGDFASYE